MGPKCPSSLAILPKASLKPSPCIHPGPAVSRPRAEKGQDGHQSMYVCGAQSCLIRREPSWRTNLKSLPLRTTGCLGGLWSLVSWTRSDLVGFSIPTHLWDREKAFTARIFHYRFLPIVLSSDPLLWFTSFWLALYFPSSNELHYSNLIKG